MRELLHHKAYLIFWGTIAVIFLGVNAGVLWKLQQIVQLLRNR